MGNNLLGPADALVVAPPDRPGSSLLVPGGGESSPATGSHSLAGGNGDRTEFHEGFRAALRSGLTGGRLNVRATDAKEVGVGEPR